MPKLQTLLPGDPVSPAEICLELETVAASNCFRKATRCVLLLRHVTSLVLENQADTIKEYALGLGVFNRPPSYDPRIDPVVRLEARRLRLKLSEYYQGEGSGDPVIIDVPKGGYVPSFRFRDERSAQEIVAAPDLIATNPPRKQTFRIATLVAVVAALVVTAFLFSHSIGARQKPSRMSVAVLPVEDKSDHQDLAYLADALGDGVTSALVQTRGIEVTARVSALRVKSGENPIEVARRLKADALVSGRISPAGAKTAVLLTLLDGRTGKSLWSRTYEAQTVDVAVIGHDAASEIAKTVGVQADVPVPALPSNAEAAELYLRACSLSRTRHPDQVRDAAALFERVIASEPGFAPAYARSASNYLIGAQNSIMRWRDVGDRGIELAQKAIELDPNLAESHSALALAWQAQWKWQEADAELVKAIELDPRSPVPHFRRAYMLTIMRRFSDAETETETAEGLDPAWGAPQGLMGEIYFYERRFDDTLEFSRKLHETEPDFSDNLTVRVYVAKQKWKMARAVMKPANRFEQDLARAIDGDVQGAYDDLVRGYRTAGVLAYHVACFSTLEMGSSKTTLDWLEQSLEDHDPDLVSLALDPMFDGLRGDRRTIAILQRLNIM